jgi:hypothetical protein
VNVRKTPINIEFTLKENARVRIDVFDILGFLSGTPFDGNKEDGPHKFVWDGS